MSRIEEIEGAWFRAVNSLVEPVAQAGLLFSPLCGSGIIVLETIGRNSGEPRRVPVLARTSGDLTLVATARAGRSQWIRNVAAEPRVRYWVGGEEIAGRAVLLEENAAMAGLPAEMAMLARFARLPCWRFAVLIPGDSAAADAA